MSDAHLIPRDRLDMAAIALHRVLVQNDFNHTFFGGYQLQLMGSIRGTKDVDVVVKKPVFHGFEKVKRAFVDHPEFLVFDGNRTDAIRAIHAPTGVGVDILLEDPPKGKLVIPDDPNELPFFPATHMFIKKIKCLSVRQKETDEEDLVFLFENYALDQQKISKKVAASQRDEALRRHGNNDRVAEILQSLDLQ
ncbi:hypothetical protein M413DRAFT_326758 [Hebeloma cylindrosporum]|uniref:Polymerase nucleotidyl transferase domain-containing protein n=1 Tax=Hebeloma cylindrosporum TaxID=76867 RepID=A0A0C3BWB2_HEBCY|nr:hypothetical protein M413DRAFT_326758 [Hebeloma cylindrosporum h7]